MKTSPLRLSKFAGLALFVVALGAYFSPSWTGVSAERRRHFKRSWTPFQSIVDGVSN